MAKRVVTFLWFGGVGFHITQLYGADFSCRQAHGFSANNELADLLHVQKGPQFNPVFIHFNAELRSVPSGTATKPTRCKC
jgi:hypothetical protein